jgi:hypothetical protein
MHTYPASHADPKMGTLTMDDSPPCHRHMCVYLCALPPRPTSTTSIPPRFLQFEDRCGKSFVMMTLMRGGMESADAVPPIFFDEITIDEPSRARLAYLPPPKREWIAPTKCVVMDCDGPKHVLIHDLDGTLMGQGADASILARAEFMHQTRADSSKYTWYNIPTKVNTSVSMQSVTRWCLVRGGGAHRHIGWCASRSTYLPT